MIEDPKHPIATGQDILLMLLLAGIASLILWRGIYGFYVDISALLQ